MTTVLLFAFLSIGASFICSILEAVLLSVTPTFVSVAKKENRSYADQLQKYKDNIDRPLIAILSFNTIAHTVGAIGVGASAESAFGSSAVGIVSAVMTALILIVSEIIPKTIGATYWKQLAGVATRTLQVLMFPMRYTGLLWFLQLTTGLIGKDAHVNTLSKEDFRVMTDMARKDGVFKDNETAMMHNLLSFADVKASDIMTPRSVIIMADANSSIAEFNQQHPDIKVSRIPIFQKSREDIVGLVLKDELLRCLVKGEGDKKLLDIKRQILVSDADSPVPNLFQTLIEQKSHMSLVVDRYGSTVGLVTMEDIIETLLGMEIMDESDHVADLQTLARRQWQDRAKRMGFDLPGENVNFIESDSGSVAPSQPVEK